MATSELTPAHVKERGTEIADREATRGGLYFTPRVDVVETDHELTLFADVPGVRPEDVDLRYEQGELVLHGRVRGKAGRREFLAKEFDDGDFFRAFHIHESIDSGKISAECKNGVLVVHLPKVEETRPKRISVRGE
jgi:HSP20 family protein